MELAYAPPYSSAKDPINIAGMVARNIIKENVKVTFWDEVDSLVNDGARLVDVRTAEEFELNRLDGSVNIPLEDMRENLNLIPQDRHIILCCQQVRKVILLIKC